MLLKKGLDKPSQLQPREQTQMGRLVLIRASKYQYGIAEAAFKPCGSKAFESSGARQRMVALKFAVCDSDDVRKAVENHLALRLTVEVNRELVPASAG